MSSERFQDLKWKPAVKKLDDRKNYFFGVLIKGVKLDVTDKLLAVAKGKNFTYCLIERTKVSEPAPLRKLNVFTETPKKDEKKIKVVKPEKTKKAKKAVKKAPKKVVKAKKVAKKAPKTKTIKVGKTKKSNKKGNKNRTK